MQEQLLLWLDDELDKIQQTNHDLYKKQEEKGLACERFLTLLNFLRPVWLKLMVAMSPDLMPRDAPGYRGFMGKLIRKHAMPTHGPKWLTYLKACSTAKKEKQDLMAQYPVLEQISPALAEEHRQNSVLFDRHHVQTHRELGAQRQLLDALQSQVAALHHQVAALHAVCSLSQQSVTRVDQLCTAVTEHLHVAPAEVHDAAAPLAAATLGPQPPPHRRSRAEASAADTQAPHAATAAEAAAAHAHGSSDGAGPSSTPSAVVTAAPGPQPAAAPVPIDAATALDVDPFPTV